MRSRSMRAKLFQVEGQRLKSQERDSSTSDKKWQLPTSRAAWCRICMDAAIIRRFLAASIGIDVIIREQGGGGARDRSAPVLWPEFLEFVWRQFSFWRSCVHLSARMHACGNWLGKKTKGIMRISKLWPFNFLSKNSRAKNWPVCYHRLRRSEGSGTFLAPPWRGSGLVEI